jgi:hypothetical protein
MLGRRYVAFTRSVAVAVVGAIAIWFAAVVVSRATLGPDAQAAAPWLALAKAASLAWVGAVGWLVSWRRLDERERETRKLSWFVGSTTAILLTAPLMVFWLVSGGSSLEHVLGRRGTPGALFAVGWGALVLAQLLGALIARVGQGIAKR